MRNVVTTSRGSPNKPCVGRKRLWHEDMVARFPKGTFERVEAVLREGESKTDFMREAAEREIARRERAKERKGEA